MANIPIFDTPGKIETSWDQFIDGDFPEPGADAQHRLKWCKHVLAVVLWKRATVCLAKKNGHPLFA